MFTCTANLSRRLRKLSIDDITFVLGGGDKYIHAKNVNMRPADLSASGLDLVLVTPSANLGYWDHCSTLYV